MDRIVATVSHFVSADDYTTLSSTVDDIDSHVKYVHDSLVTFSSDHDTFHKEEKEKYNKEFNLIKQDLHRSRVALRWAIAGLICSGVAILALWIHLIS